MPEIEEVKELLEKIDKHIIHHTCGYTLTQDLETLKDYTQQALAKLRSIKAPEPTEFTKEMRLTYELRPKIIEAKIAAKHIFNLCDIIEELESALDMAKIHNAIIKKNRNEFFDETVRLQAQIDKLVAGQQAKLIR